MNKLRAGKTFILIVVLAVLYLPSFSQGRTEISLDGYWKFTKDVYTPGQADNLLKWERVVVPHTWNKEDVTDDDPGYYRGACWYKRTINLNTAFQNKKLFIYFEGANQQTEVYVNGKKAGSHTGGYTRFCIQVDKYLNWEPGAQNEIAVRVDNSYNENIPPLTADFTFFGGIYRDVSLIVTDNVHFSLENASNGIYISTPAVSASKASVKIRGQILKETVSAGKLQLVTTLLNKEAKSIAEKTSPVKWSGNLFQFEQDIPEVLNPHLWTPEDPYLYTVLIKVVNTATGEVLDEVSSPLGFRWFRFDPDEGFFLNDKHYKLIGTSRHQDFLGLGNALPDSYHVSDMKLLKEMGANFLRIAHYPQDPSILEMCDKLGILASVEIPVVNAITETDEFFSNCRNMQVEMIRQNYNHPSVIIWAYMNEVLLRPKFGNDKPRQQQYFSNINKLARELDSLTRKEDPSRYTMMSDHGDFDGYKRVGLIQIPMLVGWNLYQGWYGGNTSGFAEFLDKHHKEFPKIPLLVTEFGADADPRIRSLQPERFDKSLEYSIVFHKTYLNAIRERPFVAAAMVWNLADFNSESREETMPHINNKGLLNQDRTAKDLYRLYQSQLLTSPYIQISDWRLRSGIADSPDRLVCTQPLMVFSNAPLVSLIVNGENLGEKKTENGTAVWNVPFINGVNKAEAFFKINEKEYLDAVSINFNVLPADLRSAQSPFNEINVLLGARRYYTDPATHYVWIPDQPYKEGSFGYTGGKPYKMEGNGRLGYGTDRNINNTENDPIYQTQQLGISSYKFDVPRGRYELTLHFAELMSNETRESLAYNLDNSVSKEKAQERIFNILVNHSMAFENFNIAERYGVLTAGSEKIEVLIDNDKGLEISFQAIKGEPVLNAVQLRKTD